MLSEPKIIDPESADVESSSDAKLLKEIRARFKIVNEHYKGWNDEAKDDYRMALGDQWDDADRLALKQQSRPCLTFNRIRPITNIVSGYQRENSARIKVNPEGGEDKVFSEVMDRALRFIDKVGHLTYTLGYQFDEGLYVGKSFVEAFKTYDKDPILGELNFELCSPYEILTDPTFKGYDLNAGCGYAFKVKRYSKSKLIELFPDKEAVIKLLKEETDEQDKISIASTEGDRDNYGNNPNKTTVISPAGEVTEPELEEDRLFLLKEYWRYKRVERFFVMNAEDGEPEMFKTEEEAQVFATKQGADIKVIKRKVPEMWVADMCCGQILQDEVSPLLPEYNGFPFFRFLGDWAPNAETETYRVQGLTRPLKDPQREKNKTKSQALHILNTQANSGWIADDDAMSDPDFKKLEEMGSKPGLVIKKKKNSELREILPKTQNQGFIIREQQADEEFRQISNINPDLMGLQDNKNTSGKAMQTRIKQAVLALSRLFSNYRYTKEILGNFILDMVPSVLDEKKLARIVGAKYMKESNIDEGTLKAYLQMVKDNKYDVLVAEADSAATERYETFTELIELAKTGAPIPPDLFIEYMDIPNSTEIKKRVQEYQQQVMAAQAAKDQKPAQQSE